jgi:hypothetical protein
MPRPVQKVVPYQFSDVGQNLRFAGGMEAMTPVVYIQPGQFEATCQAARDAVALKDRNGGAIQLP